MKSDIHVCADWETVHDRPVYTLGETCPDCGADAVNAAPAPFAPDDPHGEYRRRAKRRAGVVAGEDGDRDDSLDSDDAADES